MSTAAGYPHGGVPPLPQGRACVIETPHGGSPAAVDLYNTLQTFVPKIKRTVHYQS